MEPYRSLQPNAGLLLPRTEYVTRRVMALPTGGAVSVPDVGVICGLLRTMVANAAEIRNRWAGPDAEQGRNHAS
jgi:hypothetical protein